jgi:hypothetical protein
MVLCLLMFAWVSASAQPCLMAVEQDPVPAAGAHEHGGHEGHGTPAEDPAHCGHCPPGAAHAVERCADGINADCAALPEASSEGRPPEIKSKQAATPAPGPAFHHVVNLPTCAAVAAPLDPGLCNHRTGPSVHIRNCVYLK